MRTIVAVVFALAMSGQCLGADREVTFRGSGDVPISGTLSLPKSTAPNAGFPAVLLIQGSGPVDRDGNVLPAVVTDVLRQVAELLAAEGVASLRYDKRGMYANRATMPADAADLPAFFAWSSFVEDARSAARFLSSQSEIDGGRVGVLGHSEGGLFALMLGESDIKLKLLVLASTPARPLGEVMHEQLARDLDHQRANSEQRTFFLEADLRVQAHIRDTGQVPLDVPAGLAAFYPAYLGPYLQSALQLDPVPVAKRLHSPTLAIYGASDTQVSVERDASRMLSALASRGDGSKGVIVPNVSHNLKPVRDPSDRGFTGPLDATVRTELAAWVRRAL